LGSGVVRAEDVDAILQKGIELRRAGRDQEALAEFQRAARVQDTPRVTAQIALAEQALGLWGGAETHLVAALGHAADPWIRKNKAALDEALTEVRLHIGTIEVWGAPDGAAVSIDGKPIGKLPKVSTTVEVGELSVQVHADGFVDFKRSLDIKPGAYVREHVELAPRAVAVAPVETVSQPAALVSTPRASPDETPPVYRRWWFWPLVGGAAIALGATALILTRGSGDQNPCNPGMCSTW
jgi:hypothetical protein